jgi:drug/metabolite transporter (DMT)-like permease
VFGSVGNVLMSRGLKDIGQISIHNWWHAIFAVLDPWVAGGTLLLIGFMAAYMTALSWADLTYVLPATAMGYVLVALLGQYVLGEHITTERWIGILLVTGGVGFVAGGRAHTPKAERMEIAAEREAEKENAE